MRKDTVDILPVAQQTIDSAFKFWEHYNELFHVKLLIIINKQRPNHQNHHKHKERKVHLIAFLEEINYNQINPR